MQQKTLKRAYCFEGKGLHTGTYSHITLCPAPEDTGIVFHRSDLGPDARIQALADFVSSTARSTTISNDGVSVTTIEHIMSALTGLGIDNALIETDNIEIPILDGSATPYIEAITADGLEEQQSPRRYVSIDSPIEVSNDKSGARVRIEPAESFSIDLTIDFGSKVLGRQHILWDESVDYATQIGTCRTFVFFHEIEFLFEHNLIKGGDVDNAIVIVEHPASEDHLDRICKLFHKEKLSITSEGYLDNLELHFPDECGRHKMLDLIGDLRLCGGFPKVKVTAFKSGHTINTAAARAVRDQLSGASVTK